MDNKRFLVPPVDIYETKDKYILVLDMPGSSKEGIEISTEGDVLTLQGKVSEIGQEWKPASLEFELSDYKRDFTIGSKVNRENIEAKYENGILTIELEKSELAKPKKIEVKAA